MLHERIVHHVASRHGFQVKGTSYLAGGDINNAIRLDTSDGQFFLKWNGDAPAGMFGAEARGLELLRSAKILKVPHVIHVHEDTGDVPSYLILEWIETGKRSSFTMQQLGEGLAALHQYTAPMHGLDNDNYIGSLPQQNRQHISWARFYAEQRIGIQRNIAQQEGKLSPQRASRLQKLIDSMEQWIPSQVPASLLHGDLWAGNYMVTADGTPAIIDPAVYYGHAEVELAFTELFGGFSQTFYDAYRANSTRDTHGYAERRSLYQLYPLMTHMNMFGGSYTRQVDAILSRFAV